MSSYLNRAISFIEQHLDEGVTAGDIARAAGAPVSQVHAAFLLLAGMTPLEYARKRRLSVAASRLMEGGICDRRRVLQRIRIGRGILSCVSCMEWHVSV